MKLSTKNVKGTIRLLSLPVCLLLMSGCSVFSPPDPNPEEAYVFPADKGAQPVGAGQSIPAAPVQAGGASESFYLRVGEPLTITFSDLPSPGLPLHAVRIRDDGKISLPYNVTVMAAGKTAGQLEEDIHNEYVPRVFKQITVSVRPEARWYFVGGQVRNPGRLEYLGKVTVLRAIDTAQGFTDFANKKKIELRRATGEKYVINWNKAVEDARFDLTVLPDDQIIVHRKYF
jgi:polysaccharide export outer membrane protein